MQRAYLGFMKENFRRIESEKTNPTPPTDTVVTDIPERKEA